MKSSTSQIITSFENLINGMVQVKKRVASSNKSELKFKMELGHLVNLNEKFKNNYMNRT